MRRKGRDIDGVLLLDKPRGITSNAALQFAKRLLNARKAGHTGSLDPLATGLLPLCFGEATKVSGFLLDADKEYAVTARLGEKTASGDADGPVVLSRPVPVLGESDIQQALRRFTGPIVQIPPMYSALKVEGQPLYKLARQGVEVERAARPVTIFDLVLEAQRENELDLIVRCSKGTYVRTLVEDIGETLGCGAHVVALRRLRSGAFALDRAYTPEQLEEFSMQNALDQTLLPVESALVDWPCVELTDDAAFFVRRGQSVFAPTTLEPGWVRLSTPQHEFLGVGQVLEDGRVAPRRLLRQTP